MTQPPKKQLPEPIEPRGIGVLVLLSVVTLGFYGFYLIYVWAKDLNRLTGSAKYRPGLLLIVSIATLGIGALVIESIYARELEREIERQHLPIGVAHLSTLVICMNAAALVFSMLPGAVVVISIPLGITASALVQHQLNLIASASLDCAQAVTT